MSKHRALLLFHQVQHKYAIGAQVLIDELHERFVLCNQYICLIKIEQMGWLTIINGVIDYMEHKQVFGQELFSSFLENNCITPRDQIHECDEYQEYHPKPEKNINLKCVLFEV